MPLATNPATDQLSSNTCDEPQPGDPRELQKLYAVYYRGFVEEARQLLVDKSKAPELVQHSFIKLWLKCSVLKPGEYFAFLRASINMHCYNYNGAKSYSPEQQDILNDIILGLACDGLDRGSLYDEICAIPPEQKARAAEAFEKWYVRGLPVNVIATSIGQSETQTQELLNLACKTLHLILSAKKL